MSNGTSVGVISLDLVVKNQIEGQLNKFKSSIQSAFSKPMEQAGKIAEQAVEKAFDSAPKAAQKAAERVSDIWHETAEQEAARMKKLIQEAAQSADVKSSPETEQKSEVVKVRYDAEYDQENVMAQVDKIVTEITEKAEQKVDNASKKVSATVSENAETAEKTLSIKANAMDDIVAGLVQKATQKIASVAKSIKSRMGSAVSYAGNAVKKTLGGAFNGLKNTAGKALNGVKSHFSKLSKSVDGVSSPIKRLTGSFKRAAKSVFLMAGAYAVFRGLKDVVTQACNSNDEFAKSLNEIKANLNIAFTPIMNTVMPYLNALMSGLASVTKTFAAFISELFGTTYQKSLEATKAAQKSADKIKETQETYLADYDVVRVSPDEKESSETDSDSGIDYSAINGDNVTLPDWAQRMKDAIKSGDWAGVGALLAEKVNGAFTNINWDKIRKKVNGAVKGITDGLNGFVKKIKWKALGKSFGNGVNTIFSGAYTFMKSFDWNKLGLSTADFLNSAIQTADWTLIGKTFASKWSAVIDYLFAFVTTFDWSGFGSSIAKSVNGWFDEIDWAKLGETVSGSIKGLLDLVMGFLENVDWQGIGVKLWTFVSGIDWTGIAEKLFKAIGEAIGAAVSLLWGFIQDAVFSIRDYFKEKIQECGGNIVEGLFKGIIDAIKDIGTWLYDHVFTPFIDGFKSVFGIHSPSTVMAEMGDYIIQGLYNAVESGIEKVKEIFGKVLSAIKGVFKGIGKWFKSTFSGVFKGVKEILSSIIQFITGIFTGNWKKAWQGVKNIFKGIWDTLSSIVKTPINLIIDLINGLTGAVENALNWIIDKINTLSFDVPDWVPGIGGETFGFDFDNVDIPEIPHLATGGLATAPTLAMVGDNRNASVDPEVISPLSKLQGMLDNSKLDEVCEILRQIYDYLKAIDFTFFGMIDGKPLFKFIQDMNSQYKRKTGVSAF